MKFTARDFIKATGARLIQGNLQAPVDGASIDTRTLKQGEFFFAIRGPHHDGHDYLKTAAERGAAGAVVQSLGRHLAARKLRLQAILQVTDTVAALQQWAHYIRQRTSAVVIGITGSNGKTTTKEMLASILSRVNQTLSTRGNLNNHLGLPLMLAETQPDHRFIVLEMGTSRPGDIALLADIARPHIGVITNIGHAHLKGLKSPEGALKEKRALLDALPEDGTAVLNQDDELLRTLIGALHCQTLSFGRDARADVRGENIQEDEQGISFHLHLQGRDYPVTVPALGRFQIYNALAASAAAHAARVPAEAIVQGLADFKPVAMRMQKIPHRTGAILIHDAYNANPSSVRASIESLCRSFPGHERWLVLGDMRDLGPDSRREHEQLGAWLATQAIDRLYLYGRDVRSVLNGMRSASRGIKQVEHFQRKQPLAKKLLRDLSPQAVILFKGSRAMKLEDIITAIQ